jgi:two-component system, LytTR family, sensor kinase
MLKGVIKKVFFNKNLNFYILYWIFYLLFFSFQRSAAQHYFFLVGGVNINYLDALKISFFTNLAFLPGVIVITHLAVNVVLPRFYFKNRFLLFSIVLILIVVLYPVVPYLIRTYIVEPYIYNDPDDYILYNYFAAMLIFVFGMVPLAGFKISGYLRERALLQQKNERDKLESELKLKEAELKLLKSQIHPHFLFNTINNLYSLSLEKSDKVPDLIIRLADMLSYIIYDCNSDRVPLSKEIDFLNSYIELQKVRYDSCDIQFNISGELNNMQIAPMILHTFIDNSFKHGPDKDSGSPWIRVTITLNDGILFFTVINSTIEEERYNKVSGIGISNAKKRLDLIYSEKHDLVINHSGNKYSVFLKLQL